MAHEHLTENGPPHDPVLNQVWSVAMARTLRAGLPLRPEITWRFFDEILPHYVRQDGRIDINHKAFVIPDLPYHYPEADGLVLRPMTAADVPVVAEVVYRRGTLPTLGAAKASAQARLADPMTAAVAWDFRGSLVQTESWMRLPDGRVEAGLTVHVNRERVGWFWREAERPLFERLLATGATTVCSFAFKSLMAHWLPLLRGVYGAKVVKEHDRVVEFEYPINLGVFRGWPERRTLPGWSWRHGDLVVREAGAEELPKLAEWIDETFGRLKRRDIAARLLHEWYVLDRAQIILGESAGKLKYIRAVRERRDDMASLGILHPMWKTPEHRAFARASFEWMAAAGYATSTSFIPESLWTHPATQAFIKPLVRDGIIAIREHGEFNEKFYEIVTDIAQYLAGPLDEAGIE